METSLAFPTCIYCGVTWASGLFVSSADFPTALFRDLSCPIQGTLVRVVGSCSRNSGPF